MTNEEKNKIKLQILKLEYIELVRNNFYAFCKHMDEGFFTKGKAHLKIVAEAMQEIADGKINKLAVSLPPRAGKSYITSLFCAWVLGKNPKGSIMRNSYSAKLAEKFSKDLKEGILLEPKYLEIFPWVKASGTIDAWSLSTNSQPSYFCAGTGGSLTGFGCNKIAILDDPIKNIEEALSETVVENTWDWYVSTHLSRLETGCPEIQIATRWSKRDVIGRLTDEYSDVYNPSFKVINVPALDENGESFCSEIKTTEEYMELRKSMDSFIWDAEFMQNPIESKGLLYPIEELNRFTLAEISTKESDGLIGYTDVADKGSDFLCSLVGKVYNGYTYITDVVFTQDGVEITEPMVAQMLIDTKCDIMKIEANNGGESFARNVRKLLNGSSFCSIIAESATTNKETRILMASGYIKEFFYFRNDYEAGSPYDKFMRQVTSYVKLGKNKHDDGCDALTGIGNFAKLYSFPKKKKKPRKPDWDFENKDKEGVYMDW